MTRYVFDTNIYIRALRNPQTDAVELERFYRAHMPATYLSSVVLHELLVGASSPRMARDLDRELFAPFETRERIVVPSRGAWRKAAEVIAQLAWREGLDRKTLPRGFVNDVLIAMSCRENGLTLVTQNERDFVRIRKVLKFDFVAPWPA